MAKETATYKKKVKDRLDEVANWSQFLTVEEIANNLNISKKTFNKYLEDYPDLEEAYQRGRAKMISTLKKSLYTVALGYEVEETTEKIEEEINNTKKVTVIKKKVQVAPSVRAICLMLSDYDPDWHTDRDAYELQKKALEIREQMTQVTEWEAQ